MIGDSTRYRSIQKIGRGSCGTCWLAEDLHLQRLVVVKQVSLVDSAISSSRRPASNSPRPLPDFLTPKLNAAMNEVCMLEDVDHVNIIKYYDNYVEEKRNTSTIELPVRSNKSLAVKDQQQATTRTVSVEKIVSIVMEFASGGDLNTEIFRRRSLLSKSSNVAGGSPSTAASSQTPRFSGQVFKTNNKHFGDIDVWLIFIQVLLAVKYIHSRRILHRDLKTRNIFFTDQGVIKLGDFGIAKQLTDEMAKTLVGSPYFMAPEIHRHLPYDEKSDIWSLGCVLFQICTLRHAFAGETMDVILQAILAYDRDVDKSKENWRPLFRVPPNYNEGSMKQSGDCSAPDSLIFLELVCRLLSVNPANRPSVSQILNMPSVLRGYRKVIEGFSEEQYPQFKHLHEYWRQSVQRKVCYLERSLKDSSIEAQLKPCKVRKSKPISKEEENKDQALMLPSSDLTVDLEPTNEEAITITKRKSAKVTTRVIKTTRRRSAREGEESPHQLTNALSTTAKTPTASEQVLDLMVVEEHESIEEGEVKINGTTVKPVSMPDKNRITQRKLHVIIDPGETATGPTVKALVPERALYEFDQVRQMREQERALVESQLMCMLNSPSIVTASDTLQILSCGRDTPQDLRSPDTTDLGISLHPKQLNDAVRERFFDLESKAGVATTLVRPSGIPEIVCDIVPTTTNTPHSARRSTEVDIMRLRGINARAYTRATAGDLRRDAQTSAYAIDAAYAHQSGGNPFLRDMQQAESVASANGRHSMMMPLQDIRKALINVRQPPQSLQSKTSAQLLSGSSSLVDSPRGFPSSMSGYGGGENSRLHLHTHLLSGENLASSFPNSSNVLTRQSLNSQSGNIRGSDPLHHSLAYNTNPLGSSSGEAYEANLNSRSQLLLEDFDADEDNDGDASVDSNVVVERNDSSSMIAGSVYSRVYGGDSVSSILGPSNVLFPRPPLSSVIGRSSLTNNQRSSLLTNNPSARSPSITRSLHYLRGSAMEAVTRSSIHTTKAAPSSVSSTASSRVSTNSSSLQAETIRPVVVAPTIRQNQPKLPKTEVRLRQTTTQKRHGTTASVALPSPRTKEHTRKEDLKMLRQDKGTGLSGLSLSPHLPPVQTPPDPRQRDSPQRTRSLSPATVERVTGRTVVRSPPSSTSRRPSVRAAITAARNANTAAFEHSRRLVRMNDQQRQTPTLHQQPSWAAAAPTATVTLHRNYDPPEYGTQARKVPQRSSVANSEAQRGGQHMRTTSGGSARNISTGACGGSSRQTLSPGQTPNSAGSNLSSTTAGSLAESANRRAAAKKGETSSGSPDHQQTNDIITSQVGIGGVGSNANVRRFQLVNSR